jgi:penicillin V acylase-like amidase (Ntn superfamily)
MAMNNKSVLRVRFCRKEAGWFPRLEFKPRGRKMSANLLWLVESQYPAFDRSKPGLSIAAWAQYVLDNFATVQDAVNALRGEPFTIVTDTVPGETRLATLHLSISDATGDSAIIEYIGGKQIIHHDRKYQVMTNSPIFDEQLALNEY